MGKPPFEEMIAISQAGSPLPPDDERVLVTELAQRAVEQVAPAELAVFPETAADYFRRPGQALKPPRRDEAVGFGLDLALVTPYLLAIATVAVQTVVATVSGAAQAEAMPAARSLVRRVFRLPSPAPDGDPVQLSPDQARRVRDRALEQARAMGLPEAQAGLLANAVVGGLVTGN
jgi:hypothetical protein